MSLREWDRKARVLRKEIGTLVEQIQKNRAGEQEKKLLTAQEQLPVLEHQLGQVLSYIKSQTERRGFYSPQEKAILHWAGTYASRAQAFFQSYTQTFYELFWAKLLRIRTESIIAHGRGRFFRADAKGHSKANRLYETRDELTARLRRVKKQHLHLEDRYNRLAVTKANLEAVCLDHVKKKHLQEWRTLLPTSNPSQVAFALPIKYLAPNQRQGAGATSTPPGREPATPYGNPIESFDYLNLAQPHQPVRSPHS